MVLLDSKITTIIINPFNGLQSINTNVRSSQILFLHETNEMTHNNFNTCRKAFASVKVRKINNRNNTNQ